MDCQGETLFNRFTSIFLMTSFARHIWHFRLLARTVASQVTKGGIETPKCHHSPRSTTRFGQSVMWRLDNWLLLEKQKFQ